jgi:phage terminase large subunit-like protein
VFIDRRNPEPPHKALAHAQRYACVQINPADNAENLPTTYLEGLQTGSARKVLRFWSGRFGDAGEAALWTLEMIERNRVAVVPNSLVRIIVAVDPSGTHGETDDGDAVGIVVAGLDQAGIAYILEDATIKLPPAGWGRVAVSAYERWEADAMIVETNFGGAMASAVIQAAAGAANVRVKIKEVTASRGKAIRAEPISAIYAEGKVCHVGPFPELEDELVSFTTAGYIGGRSPNRADAAIWACTEFFGRVTQSPERRHRPPPRVMLSPGATRQLGGGPGYGGGGGRNSGLNDMSPARRRAMGLERRASPRSVFPELDALHDAEAARIEELNRGGK